LLYNRDVLPWSYAGVVENSFHFPAESLRLSMTKHPSMKVFVGSGLYDGAVPYLAVENALDVVGRNPKLVSNLTVRNYETGHILYLEEPAGTQVRDDLAGFIGGACRE
jgi:carboxypeptidase C (cathepsin A)